jgi:hypothetical protein
MMLDPLQLVVAEIREKEVVQKGLDNELDIVLAHLFIGFFDVVVHDVVLNEAFSENILLLELPAGGVAFDRVEAGRLPSFRTLVCGFIFLIRAWLRLSCSGLMPHLGRCRLAPAFSFGEPSPAFGFPFDPQTPILLLD